MSRLKNSIIEFLTIRRQFGWNVSFYSTAFKFFHKRFEEYKVTDFFNKKKDNSILQYLQKKYGNLIIEETSKIENQSNLIVREKYIWICWWQGEDQMPLIVQRCYKSVVEHSKSYKVVLITKYNYKEFVHIPQYVLSKLETNSFSLTHFSDILRVSLLAENGGFWIDATVFVTQDININQRLFTIRHQNYGHHPSQRCWTQFLIGGDVANPLFYKVRDLFYAYWKEENSLINYFLIDYFIRLVYENNTQIRNLVDSLPYSNPDLYYILEYFDSPFDLEMFKKVSLTTTFHKLKWKQPLKEYTDEGLLTYYGYIIHNLK